MARRADHELASQTSLDYPEERKSFGTGPFTGDEELIIWLLGPWPFSLGVTLAYYPIGKAIGAPTVIAVGVFAVCLLIAFCSLPPLILAAKKGKAKSWLFDAAHRRRWGMVLFFFRGTHHFPRPKKDEIYTHTRRLVRSSWTRAGSSLFVHSEPAHLTLGLPPVRIYSSKAHSWGRSITPEFSSDRLCLMHHSHQSHARRIPDYLAQAVIGRDPDGHAPIQDYLRTYTPWTAPRAAGAAVVRPAPDGPLAHEPSIQITNTIAHHERGTLLVLIGFMTVLILLLGGVLWWVSGHQLAYQAPGVYSATPLKIHWGSHD